MTEFLEFVKFLGGCMVIGSIIIGSAKITAIFLEWCSDLVWEWTNNRRGK